MPRYALICCVVLLSSSICCKGADEKKVDPYEAIRDKDSNSLRKFLAQGGDVNTRPFTAWNQKQTLLHIATSEGNEEIIEILLDAGADVTLTDQNGATALHWAARYDRDKAVKILLDHKADVNARNTNGETPLLYAVDSHKSANAILLINSKADVNLRANNGWSALHAAHCDEDLVQALLSAGARVNAADKNGYTPLHHACSHGDCDVVKLLIKAKADVNQKDADGWSTLHWVIGGESRSIDDEIVETLLTAKADVNATDKQGRSPLHLFAGENVPDLVTRLIEAGAKLNAQNKQGWTPLHFAVEYGDIATLEVLLKRKPDVNLRTREGRTAIANAADIGDVERVKLLRTAGAVEKSWTTLHWAAVLADAKLVQKALDEKNDPEARDVYGRSPLFWAVGSRGGTAETVVKHLIRAKANVNVKDKQGRTPIQQAARNSSAGPLKALLTAKASLQTVDSGGWTAIHYASSSGFLEGVRLLISAGGKTEACTKDFESPLSLAIIAKSAPVARALLGMPQLSPLSESDEKDWNKKYERRRANEKFLEHVTEVEQAWLALTWARSQKVAGITVQTPRNTVKKMIASMQVGNEAGVFACLQSGLDDESKSSIIALCSIVRSVNEFRGKMIRTYGKKGLVDFRKHEVDNVNFTFSSPKVLPASLEKLKITINGDRAETGPIEGLENCKQILLFREKGIWRIDRNFIREISIGANLGAITNFFRKSNKRFKKAIPLIGQKGHSPVTIKEAFMENK